MKRYLKYKKGEDGKLRMYGYEDNGITQSLYGICYSKDFKEVEIIPNEKLDAQSILDSLGEREKGGVQ